MDKLFREKKALKIMKEKAKISCKAETKKENSFVKNTSFFNLLKRILTKKREKKQKRKI